MKKAHHVVPKADGRWAVRKYRSARASRVFSNRRDAVQYAKKAAQKQGGFMYIHDSDGRVRSRTSYGDDLVPAKG